MPFTFPGRKSKTAANGASSPPQQAPHSEDLSKVELKRNTKTRKRFAVLTSFLLFISVIFLILVEVGNTDTGKVVRDIYFLRLDLSQVIPTSTAGAAFVNSFARTIGLHDYYQVGLWNYCAGYKGEGTGTCSKPETLYWFNPVEIITSELIAGASIALPPDAVTILNIVRILSKWMFGLFLAGACLEFVMIFLAPLSIYSKLVALIIAPLTFLAALFTTVATVIATAMFVIFQKALGSFSELNIGAKIGTKMFVFMWIGAAFALFAAFIQIGLCCCCTSRRDVKKRRSNGAYSTEKPKRKGVFGRRQKV